MALQAASSRQRVVHWAAIGMVVGYVVAVTVVLAQQRSVLGIVLFLIAGIVSAAVVVASVLLTARAAEDASDQIDELYSELEAERAARQQAESEHRNLHAVGDARAAALRHIEHHQLPALLHDSPAPMLPELASDGFASDTLRRIAELRWKAAEHYRSRQVATESVLVALSRSVQANAHRIQEQTTRSLDRHPNDPDVLETCMQIDHAAAQQARRAQTLAVLCGEEPGQQWREPLPLEDVVRAASARITAYQRVDIPGDSGLAISANLVESAIHLIAELLANATQLSPPTTIVPVAVRQVQRGAVIEIDDGGVGVNDTEIDELRRIASGQVSIRLADLGESPRTGLAVVGRYVQRHGFRVDLAHSVYGGLRAIVLVPAEFVVLTPAPQQAQSGAPTPSLPSSLDPDTASLPNTGVDSLTSQDGLPQRRSRRAESELDMKGLEAAVEWPGELPTESAERCPEEEGQWMAAFLNAAPGTIPDILPSEDTEKTEE